MRSFHRFAGQGSIQLALALVAVGSWVSGCGDDESSGGGGGKGKGGSSGTAGAAGAAGSVTGGSAGSTTAGSGGTAAGTGGNGGSGGMPVAGNAGSAGSAGAAGSAGSGGMGGEPGGGGEGGMGDGGMAGTAGSAGAGMGGEGGSGDMMCATGDLSLTEDSIQAHDHLPVVGMDRQTLLAMINSGTPLVFTMPEDGTNAHTHTLTFTAAQLTTLRNGGSVEIESSTGGPAANMHEHTFTLECAP